jgi:molybdopterin-guanine dinucleotide biosynthesis protein A
MGQCKSGLRHPSGGSFWQHAITELAKVSDAIAISLSPLQTQLIESVHAPVKILLDQTTDRGPAEGLARSLQYAIAISCTGVLVTPVDLPFLHGHELQSLTAAFEESPTQITCGVSTVQPDKIEPLVAIYPVSMANQIETLVASDDRSLYRFIRRNDHQCVQLSRRSLANVNTPEDLFIAPPQDLNS